MISFQQKPVRVSALEAASPTFDMIKNGGNLNASFEFHKALCRAPSTDGFVLCKFDLLIIQHLL